MRVNYSRRRTGEEGEEMSREETSKQESERLVKCARVCNSTALSQVIPGEEKERERERRSNLCVVFGWFGTSPVVVWREW